MTDANFFTNRKTAIFTAALFLSPAASWSADPGTAVSAGLQLLQMSEPAVALTEMSDPVGAHNLGEDYRIVRNGVVDHDGDDINAQWEGPVTQRFTAVVTDPMAWVRAAGMGPFGAFSLLLAPPSQRIVTLKVDLYRTGRVIPGRVRHLAIITFEASHVREFGDLRAGIRRAFTPNHDIKLELPVSYEQNLLSVPSITITASGEIRLAEPAEVCRAAGSGRCAVLVEGTP